MSPVDVVTVVLMESGFMVIKVRSAEMEGGKSTRSGVLFTPLLLLIWILI